MNGPGPSSMPPDDGDNDWRRRELIWALRWLAAEPDAALAAHAGIVTADEIALDVAHWLQVALTWGLLDEASAQAVRSIDDTFTAMSDAGPELWTDEALRLSPEWDEQRERARAVLSLLGESRADAELGEPREGGATYVTYGRESRYNATG